MARATKAAKAKNHGKIVALAAELIRTRGIDGLNVSDAMNAAGLTHGGFYRHFSNKNQLIQEAISAAFQQFIQKLRDDLETCSAQASLARFVDRYLSLEHVQNPKAGCPAAALGAEIARQDAATRAVFNNGASAVISLLDQALAGSSATPIADGRAIMATLMGTVILARNTDGVESKQSILSSSKGLLGF